MKKFNNWLVKPKKTKWAKFKGTVATVASLCIVCTVFIASLLSSGCNKKEDFSKMEDFKSAPFVYVPREELPKWLNEWINCATSDFVGVTIISRQVEVHRGKWKGETVYNVWSANSSSLLDVRNEKGEKIEVSPGNVFNREEFFSKSNGWELIFQMVGGVETTTGTN